MAVKLTVKNPIQMAKISENRVMTKKDLCKAYRISRPTLKKWLSAIPDLQIKSHQRYILPEDLDKIAEIYGRILK